MAHDAEPATDSIVDVPDTISISFLPQSETLSERVITKGLNYFTQSYIHDVRVLKLEKSVRVDAKCWRSMRKSEQPYALQIEIDVAKSILTESYCKCKAGYV
jgi:hypothetical protein